MPTRSFLLLAGPSMFAMLALTAIPLADGFWLSLHSFSFRGDLLWRGFDNYAATFDDPDFWRAIGFTLKIAVISVPVSLLLGFGSALVLMQLPVWLRGAVIACILLPFVVTTVVGTLAFSWMFRDFGIVTYWLGQLGIRIFWMGSDAASQSLVLMHWVWHTTPFATVILFAGLQTVPAEQLEAAAMDGGGAWARLRHVVLPHLQSLFVFLAIIMVMDGYRIFDSIFVMTKGINGTESVMLYWYRVAIEENALNRGAAIAFLTVIGILVLLSPFLWLTWREHRGLRR